MERPTYVSDIAMIGLVPILVFVVVLVIVGLLWKSNAPKDKGAVMAIATSAAVAVAAGWELYRFGWKQEDWVFFVGFAVCIAAAYFGTWWISSAMSHIGGVDTRPETITLDSLRTAAPLLVPLLLAIVGYAAFVVWSALK